MRDIIETMIKILLSLSQAKDKSKTTVSQQIAALLEAHQQDEKTLLALKQCLKAWDVPFEGSDAIPDLSPEFYDQLPPAHLGKYFSDKMYPRMYALSHLAYTAEQNGIPAEHATKLCVMFTDEKTALAYLQKYTQSAQTSATPFHDALLFSLPDFQAPGFLDPKTGCKFELFQVREKGKTVENLLSKEFKQLLPFAFELQQRVVAAKEANKTVKPDGRAIKAAIEDIHGLVKRYDTLDRNRQRLNDNEKQECKELLASISEKRCALAVLCAGKSLKDLTLAELSAFYEVYKLDASPSYKIFVDNDIPVKYFAEFQSLDRSKAGAHIPDVRLAGETIGHRGFYLMKVPVATDEQQAARAACLGKLTKCCQSLSGAAGHACVRHGLTSPYGGFYVLCQGDSKAPKVSDPVIAQSWAWRSQSDAIVFDSIETANENTNITKRVTHFYRQLGKVLVEQGYTNKVACGVSSGISSEVGIDAGVVFFNESFKDYNGYSDATQQRAIYDLLLPPYLFYDIYEACRKKTLQIITEAANDIPNLRGNKPFVELLNWVVMTKKEYLHQIVKNLFKSKEKADALKSITEALEDYHQKREVKALVHNLDYVDVRNEAGDTPLHWAARNGHLEIFKMLIDKGADIDAKEKYGETPLMLAAKNGHVDVCSMLIEKGADIHEKDNSPLMLAARYGHVDVCKMLLEKGADIHVKDNYGATPLMLAARYGHLEVGKMLIEKGAEIDIKSKFVNQILLWAAKEGRLDVISILIEKGAYINAKNEDGDTPLILAAKNRHVDVCSMLIEKGAKVDEKNQRGDTPLILAVKNGHVDVCSILIEKGADIHAKDNGGETPLMLAAQSRHLEVCKKLIEKDADINATNTRGENSLLLALRYGRRDVASMLIEMGADIHAKDNRGVTPLLLAVQRGYLEICKKLIEKGVEIDIKSKFVNQILLWAAKEGRFDVCSMLVEKGVDIHAKDQYGETPLISAALRGHRDICIALLRAGATWDDATLQKLRAFKHPEINTIIAERLAPPTLPASADTRRQKVLFRTNVTLQQSQESTSSAQSDVKHTRDEVTKLPKP